MNITIKTGKKHTTIMVWAAIFLLAGAGSALAHARLIKSAPDNNIQLSSTPSQVDLWFNELLDDGFNTIDVFPADQLGAAKHDNLAKGVPVVDPKDRTHLTITLAVLKPGDYIVNYRVLSRDGHTAPGRITFHITPPDSKVAIK